MYKHVPQLFDVICPHLTMQECLKRFRDYKASIPVCGVILLHPFQPQVLLCEVDRQDETCLRWNPHEPHSHSENLLCPSPPPWEEKESLLAKPSLWTFPQGKIEYGETHAECAAREFQEETGLSLSSDALKNAPLVLSKPFIINIQPHRTIKQENHRFVCFASAAMVSDVVTTRPQTRGEIHRVCWAPLSWVFSQSKLFRNRQITHKTAMFGR